jgi:hypothetical protein
LQGLTLPPLVRAMGLSVELGPNLEEEAARRDILRAALDYLEKSREADVPESAALYEDMAGHYRERLAHVSEECSIEMRMDSQQHERLSRVSRELLQLERSTAVRLRNEGRIDDEILRQIERELDLRASSPSH